jgi:hypothetical protein
MSELYERLRIALPGAEFAPPATEEEIARVEGALGNEFPEWLHQLYRCCNGIAGKEFHDPYLWPLENSSDPTYGLLGWNRFLRQNCDELRDISEANGKLDNWERSHARNFLIIGCENAVNWAIDVKTGGPEIIWYDERNPDDFSVLGDDLADVCARIEAKNREIHDELFRGREPIRRESDPLPPSTDIELILETLIELGRGTKGVPMFAREATSPNCSLYHCISQRPGETGMLFILAIHSFEIQIATRDGNLPFVFRVKTPFRQEPFRCLVKNLFEAMHRILCLIDVVYYETRDNRNEREAAGRRINGVWRDSCGPAIPELDEMAETLFRRDDNRLVEDNRLGA